jgi:hypothetical protein
MWKFMTGWIIWGLITFCGLVIVGKYKQDEKQKKIERLKEKNENQKKEIKILQKKINTNFLKF